MTNFIVVVVVVVAATVSSARVSATGKHFEFPKSTLQVDPSIPKLILSSRNLLTSSHVALIFVTLSI